MKKYNLEYQKVGKNCITILVGYKDNYKKVKDLSSDQVKNL
jgi:hypothetical protein